MNNRENLKKKFTEIKIGPASMEKWPARSHICIKSQGKWLSKLSSEKCKNLTVYLQTVEVGYYYSIELLNNPSLNNYFPNF